MNNNGPYRGSEMGDRKIIIGQFSGGQKREVVLPENRLEVDRAAKTVAHFKETNRGRRLDEESLAELLSLLFTDAQDRIKYSDWIQELYEATPLKKRVA